MILEILHFPLLSITVKFEIFHYQVKSLLTVRPETETPVSEVSIRKIPR